MLQARSGVPDAVSALSVEATALIFHAATALTGANDLDVLGTDAGVREKAVSQFTDLVDRRQGVVCGICLCVLALKYRWQLADAF